MPLCLSDLPLHPLFLDSVYIPVLLFRSVLLYSRNILDTKNVGYHIYISIPHAVQILATCFFLSDIRQNCLRSSSAVYLHTCGYGLHTRALILFLFLSSCRAPVVFSLYLLLTFHIFLFVDISAQILYDTCIPIGYVLNYYRPFGLSSFAFRLGVGTIFIIAKEDFFVY